MSKWKNNSVIAFVVLAIMAMAYFLYLTFSSDRNDENENIFLQDIAKVDSAATELNEKEIILYNDTKLKFKDLPQELQKKIRNEQMVAHVKINTLLKEYVINYHLAKTNNKGKEVDPKNLPKIDILKEMGVDVKVIDQIYEQNKHQFPKNHDPAQVKADMTVKLVSNKIYEFYQTYLNEIYLKEDLSLPSFPQFPESWTQTKVTQSYGNQDAPFHLVWVGSYTDVNSKLIKEDIGLLVKKYGLKELKVSFIPFSNGTWDLNQKLNALALCVKKEKGEKNFWSYHTQALNHGKDLVAADPKAVDKAIEFARKVMSEIDFPQEEQNQIIECADNKNKQNPIFLDLLRAKKELSFIPDQKIPFFILNGRLLDLDGSRVFRSVDQSIQNIQNKKKRKSEGNKS
ncbi:MAG: hypothetical protein CME63_15640 [Halobacteriovoraceae bacterium]|nr:hypothetical protein [Halobacteriovoraceae bacterium]|tara:strand:- start:194770 stop:195966 length:1197 start_codon:yes stop_codon:yes gene_type:complete